MKNKPKPISAYYSFSRNTEDGPTGGGWCITLPYNKKKEIANLKRMVRRYLHKDMIPSLHSYESSHSHTVTFHIGDGYQETLDTRGAYGVLLHLMKIGTPTERTSINDQLRKVYNYLREA